MTLLFVQKESLTGERRVAATPETVKNLVKLGLDVAVEPGAGASAGFPDRDYETAGAKIEDATERADVLFGVRTPDAERIARLRDGATVISSLVPTMQLDQVRALRDAGITSFGMELVPRITRAQKMDVLSSQATCAGYQAVLQAAAELPSFFPLLMTAAGTIRPARVFVLGAGVAGLQAIATAKRLGAQVEANDVRSAAAEQVESLGAKFVDTGTPPDAETKGGYAKEASEDYLRKQREILTKHVGDASVVITTALIPGRPAPRIVTAEMVAAMRPGSVIVDLAAPNGGNVEGTEPDHVVTTDNGVRILGYTDLPSRMAGDASRMWARNVQGFFELMWKDGALAPDFEDEILAATCVTRGKEVVHAPTRDAMENA